MSDLRGSVASIVNALESADLVGGLRWLAETYPGAVGLATALGKEAQLIADAIWRANLDVRVFTLDTGRLFDETYALLDETRRRYGRLIEIYCPDTRRLESMLRAKGHHSFYRSLEDRLECCRIRKVEPLQRALRGLSILVTGRRAAQSDYRRSLTIAAWDEEHGLVKVNPLRRWTDAEVDEYIARHDVPVNALHARGFASIGCAPCTRAVAPGDPPRSGRWWWELSTRECGLHR
jgi:phosphoadenosine phosphosulfate reductase